MPDCRYVIDAPAAARPLLARALSDLGMRETAPNSVPGLTDMDPRAWCAALATRWLHDCNVPLPGSDSARELLRQLGAAGYSIPHDGELRGGDVVGWERRDAAGQVIGAHVAVVLAVTEDGLEVIAGNSGPGSRRTWISLVDRARVQWAARPMR